MVLVCHRPAQAAAAAVGLLLATLVGAVYGLATGRFRHATGPAPYTHLTLPTVLLVESSVVA